MNKQFELQTIDVNNLPNNRWEQFLALATTLFEERDPLLPPPTAKELLGNLQNIPPFIDFTFLWVVDKVADSVVAVADLMLFNDQMPQNQHVAQVNISVAVAYRRQGIGTALLNHIVTSIEASGQSLIMGNTHSAVPSGEAFAQQLAAEVGLGMVANQLAIADLNMELMRSWLAQGRLLADEYELLFIDGPCPDELVEAFVELLQVMNSAPRDDLDVEDFEFSAEQLRQMEQSYFREGRERWTYAVRHKPTQKLAGYTDMNFRPSAPQLANQGGTVVVPEFRGNRIGSWLKASMITRVIEQRPAVQYIRTGNANSNAPMLKINDEMGFRPHHEDKTWQLPIEKARAYLDNR